MLFFLIGGRTVVPPSSKLLKHETQDLWAQHHLTAVKCLNVKVFFHLVDAVWTEVIDIFYRSVAIGAVGMERIIEREDTALVSEREEDAWLIAVTTVAYLYEPRLHTPEQIVVGGVVDSSGGKRVDAFKMPEPVERTIVVAVHLACCGHGDTDGKYYVDKKMFYFHCRYFFKFTLGIS